MAGTTIASQPCYQLAPGERAQLRRPDTSAHCKASSLRSASSINGCGSSCLLLPSGRRSRGALEKRLLTAQARISSKEDVAADEERSRDEVEAARLLLAAHHAFPADGQKLRVREMASSIRQLRKGGAAAPEDGGAGAAAVAPAAAPIRGGPFDVMSGPVRRAAMGVLEGVLAAGVTERRADRDPLLEKNYAAVPEVGARLGPLTCVAGAVPTDFPQGTYIRNGPNPLYHPVTRETAVGASGHHWFEGDGMLHAVTVGSGGEVSYVNRFVETQALAQEKLRRKPLFWGSFNADTLPLVAGMMLNMMQFGSPAKLTANTNVIAHHGKLLALQEADAPYEVTLPDLETVGRHTFGGTLKMSMTAHPKIDPSTGNLHFFNYSAIAPFCQVGVVSPAGEIIHVAPVDMGRATFMHDFGITRNFCVLLDFPLTIDFKRLFSSGSLIEFEPHGKARIGVMPKFGDSKSVRWFTIKPGFAFHVMNAYEDGNEVVLHGTRQTNPVLRPPKGVTWGEFLPEQVAPPHGGMLTHLHEWRLNLATGEVFESQLVPPGLAAEFPRINDQFCGQKYKYGYAVVPDLASYEGEGVPLYTEMAKFHLPGGPPAAGRNAYINVEHHKFGPKQYCGEPTFVPRPGADVEDDGWVVTLIYDELANASEFYIIDAQNFEGPPVARIRLPQRVPYGLHGTFVPAGAVSRQTDN